MITVSSYIITTSDEYRPVGVRGVPTFEQAKLACKVHLATHENRNSVLSVRDNNGRLVAVYVGTDATWIVVDRKVLERADTKDGFDLDEWDGIWVNEIPYGPSRAAIVEGPVYSEDRLTEQPFSLTDLLRQPSEARDVDGYWYRVQYPEFAK